MCDNPQPTMYCPCGHHRGFHKASGPCKYCECAEYAGPRLRRPDWVGALYGLESVITSRHSVVAPEPESHFRDLLSKQVGGRTEVTLPFGRADVLTDTTIFEVEPAARWRAGASQALQYAAQVPQKGALALYGNGVKLATVRAGLSSLPSPGLELWWLAGDLFLRVKDKPARPAADPAA